jgi:hypothetical protein
MDSNSSRFTKFSYSTMTHKGKPVKNITTSPSWANVHNLIGNAPSNVTQVPTGMEGRPDLIAHKFYGDSTYWWIICVANNISDPFEQLIAGKLIKLPLMD